MKSAVQRRGVTVAAIVAAALLASCGTTQSELQAQAAAERAAAEAAAALAPPPVTLDAGVAEVAAVYVAFTREMSAMQGGFDSPEAVQAALRSGSSYNAEQLSRGLVAYASILALQSPEYVAGVRQYTLNPDARRELAAKIIADPRQASYIEGADAAAQLVTSMLKRDIDALGRAANSVENDAYAVQARHDPRRGWGVAEVFDREGRLARTKALSAQDVLPSASEAAELLAAAQGGRALSGEGQRRKPPYPPVIERALAIAALAALGEGGRANTDALQIEPVSERCLNLSKLMLYQCLAASRPSYEDMFCVGRHVVRDLATCTRGAAMPAAIVTVSDVVPAPSISPAPFTPAPPARSEPAPAPTPVPPPVRITPPPPRIQTPAPRPRPVTPAQTPAQPPAPAPNPASPASSITERLNTGPGAGR